MNIINALTGSTTENIHRVKAKTVYDAQNAVAVHITLEPGENLKPHRTPVDVFFYILEGGPTVEIDGERQKVKADHLVESPANIRHCIYNETAHRARILVVKVPKPTKPTQVL